MAYIRALDAQNTRKKGDTGEEIACRFLVSKGFRIIDRNYRKLWGELDIVAQKDTILHFVEVKSVMYDLSPIHSPEENVHGLKVVKLKRMIQTFMLEKGYSCDSEFHFHVICVYIDVSQRRVRVKWIKDVIL